MANRTLIKSIVVLVGICLVISGALAIVNSFTAPVIAANGTRREAISRQKLLPEAERFQELPRGAMPETVTGAYVGVDSAGREVGYVFTANAKGFKGNIVVMAAMDPEGRLIQVSAVDVTCETASLGGLVEKESYTAQYAGKDASLQGVDAISGATITSKAFEQGIKDCFQAYRTLKEG